MRQAPPVKAELPPRQCSGATSSISTETPFSLADSAVQVAALPAPMTMTSCSGMSTPFLLLAQPPAAPAHRRALGRHIRAVRAASGFAQKAGIVQERLEVRTGSGADCEPATHNP